MQPARKAGDDARRAGFGSGAMLGFAPRSCCSMIVQSGHSRAPIGSDARLRSTLLAHLIVQSGHSRAPIGSDARLRSTLLAHLIVQSGHSRAPIGSDAPI